MVTVNVENFVYVVLQNGAVKGSHKNLLQDWYYYTQVRHLTEDLDKNQ